MTAPRESIITALLARLKTITDFVTVGQVDPTVIQRDWKGPEAADFLDKLPGLFLIELPEKHAVRGRGMPAIIDWGFDVVFVVKNLDDVPPGSRVNPLLDALDTLFIPTPQDRMTGRNTLGGIVYDVWIEGTVQKNFAYLGGRASLAVAPLHVRITNPS